MRRLIPSLQFKRSVATAVGIGKLNSELGALSLMLLAYIFIALWLARREDARKERAHQARHAKNEPIRTPPRIECSRVRRNEYDPP